MPWAATTLPTTSASASASISAVLLAELLDQRLDAVRGLRTLAYPVVQALFLQLQAHFTTTSQRVEVTQTLDKTAITCIAAVGDNHAVERTLLGPTTGQTNRYHKASLSLRMSCFRGAIPRIPADRDLKGRRL